MHICVGRETESERKREREEEEREMVRGKDNNIIIDIFYYINHMQVLQL